MSKEYKHCEIVGPFTEPEYSYAVIDGYKVPYIKLRPLSGADDGKTEIYIDSCVWIVESTALDVTLHLLAKAMAVAAGYNNHGEHSERFNPFKVKMVGLS